MKSAVKASLCMPHATYRACSPTSAFLPHAWRQAVYVRKEATFVLLSPLIRCEHARKELINSIAEEALAR